jgi:hypothetical protein
VYPVQRRTAIVNWVFTYDLEARDQPIWVEDAPMAQLERAKVAAGKVHWIGF